MIKAQKSLLLTKRESMKCSPQTPIIIFSQPLTKHTWAIHLLFNIFFFTTFQLLFCMIAQLDLYKQHNVPNISKCFTETEQEWRTFVSFFHLCGAEFNLTLFGLDSSLLIPKDQRVLWGLYSLKRFHICFRQKLLSRASKFILYQGASEDAGRQN